MLNCQFSPVRVRESPTRDNLEGYEHSPPGTSQLCTYIGNAILKATLSKGNALGRPHLHAVQRRLRTGTGRYIRDMITPRRNHEERRSGAAPKAQSELYQKKKLPVIMINKCLVGYKV